MIDLGVDLGIVEKSGSWYSYEGERLGQGRENAKQTLQENADMSARIEGQLRAHFELPGGTAAEPAAEAEGA